MHQSPRLNTTKKVGDIGGKPNSSPRRSCDPVEASSAKWSAWIAVAMASARDARTEGALAGGAGHWEHRVPRTNL